MTYIARHASTFEIPRPASVSSAHNIVTSMLAFQVEFMKVHPKYSEIRPMCLRENSLCQLFGPKTPHMVKFMNCDRAGVCGLRFLS